jgi:hypothetical protein
MSIRLSELNDRQKALLNELAYINLSDAFK